MGCVAKQRERRLLHFRQTHSHGCYRLLTKKTDFRERGIYDNEVLHVEGGVDCVTLEASCKCVAVEQMKYSPRKTPNASEYR